MTKQQLLYEVFVMINADKKRPSTSRILRFEVFTVAINRTVQ
jgi:hypothetical protein